MTLLLVTTADERTWKSDRSIMFLGEWCRRYDRREIWQGLNASVAEPFGIFPADRDRNLAYVEALTQQLLTELVDLLNEFHDTNYTRRYWQIVLGHWLQRYVGVVFNRYFNLEQVLESCGPFETNLFDGSNYSLATSDSLEFILACGNDEWNHILYGKILNFLGGVKIHTIPGPINDIGSFKRVNASGSSYRLFKQLALNVLNSMSSRLSKKNDAMIIKSYLPIWEELKLQLCLGQWPQFWKSPFIKTSTPDALARQSFKLHSGNSIGFEQFIRTEIGSMIPTCFIEGYENLEHQANTLPWPSKPRHIFTSNCFDTDEVFKVWTGMKVEQGAPYFTGQHGNNYGTHVNYGNASWPERSASDRFITWGDWVGDQLRNSPAFLFKTAGVKPNNFNPEGGVLLVENVLEHRIQVGDIHHQHCLYQEAQFRFIECLPKHLYSSLTVRLHKEFKSSGWCDDRRWRDAGLSDMLEYGDVNIDQLIKRSRLVIHSYDSTGVLETFSLNIPTLCFWSGGLDHVLPIMRPYYELLRSAGILVETPEQAADFVSSRWDDIGEWWNSCKVQDTRTIFCKQFARTDKTPVRTLSRLLRQLEAELESVVEH